MKPQNNIDRIRCLVDYLNRCRDYYYNQNRSLVSDKIYDEKFDELRSLEKATGIVLSNSPTINVGYAAVSGLKKVKHNHPLLSLDKTTDPKEFNDYFGTKDIVVMGKMDGLTASIRYVNGELVSAESRGDGNVGEDITHNAMQFVNLPKKIPFDGELIVDGECIIPYYAFNKINENENTEYKNPRNLVSGTVRQLDSAVCARRNVRFIAWRLYKAVNKDGTPKYAASSYHYGFNFLANLGFEVVPYVAMFGRDYQDKKTRQNNINEVIGDIRDICVNIHDYPIDGIVGAFDDVAYGEGLGFTSHHPKYALAFKFYQEENETVLRDIEWNVSRTGLINPVAVFDPVEIDGTTVTRATLNNVSFIEGLELGIGDTITVIKANQIIPMITGNKTGSGTYQIPTVCPCCGSRTEIRNDNGREMLYCTNKVCSGRVLDSLSHFVSREGMNIAGLSDAKLKTLCDYGYVEDFIDLYLLGDCADELCQLPGFGPSSVDQMLKAIEASEKCSFANFLVAIGIPYVGKSAAKAMAKYIIAANRHTKLVNELIDLALNNHNWTDIESFGVKMSDAINEFVRDNIPMIGNLGSILTFTDGDLADDSKIVFGGETFCITGKLNVFSNRDALCEAIEKHGGRVVSGVTAKTNYLITNDQNSGSSKNQKAVQYGTKIITEQQFIDMCGGEA